MSGRRPLIVGLLRTTKYRESIGQRSIVRKQSRATPNLAEYWRPSVGLNIQQSEMEMRKFLTYKIIGDGDETVLNIHQLEMRLF